MTFERGLNDAALHATPTSVNQSHLTKSRAVRGIHVLFDNGLDVSWLEGVQIEGVFDWNSFQPCAF
jgi:hypothetical protein